ARGAGVRANVTTASRRVGGLVPSTGRVNTTGYSKVLLRILRLVDVSLRRDRVSDLVKTGAANNQFGDLATAWTIARAVGEWARLLPEVLGVTQLLGEQYLQAEVLSVLGLLAHRFGLDEEAQPVLERALTLYDARGKWWKSRAVRGQLAVLRA